MLRSIFTEILAPVGADGPSVGRQLALLIKIPLQIEIATKNIFKQGHFPQEKINPSANPGSLQ